jgi:hypothetical protein
MRSLCYFALSLLTLTWTHYSLSAEREQLTNGLFVKPERCVALRQGQTCYQEVTFRWHQPHVGNYCLVNLSTKQTLKCWKNSNQGMFHLDFQSTQSTDFVLRAQDQDVELSKIRISVSWVFKSSKRPKSSWKLF